ncbi:MAG TPA: hypothetical protein VGN49_00095 [Micrococcaceae bacterium]|jgi:ABC-type Fe3+ transport system permease subunit|nr:hypothetical protein [Micrococcaceae bacterium]
MESDDGAEVQITENDDRTTTGLPTGPGSAANPFLLALWLGGTGLAVLSILTEVVAAYRDLGQGFSSSTSTEGMPLLIAVQPFAVPGLVLGLGAVIAALILRAIRWDAQHADGTFTRR